MEREHISLLYVSLCRRQRLTRPRNRVIHGTALFMCLHDLFQHGAQAGGLAGGGGAGAGEEICVEGRVFIKAFWRLGTYAHGSSLRLALRSEITRIRSPRQA